MFVHTFAKSRTAFSLGFAVAAAALAACQPKPLNNDLLPAPGAGSAATVTSGTGSTPGTGTMTGATATAGVGSAPGTAGTVGTITAPVSGTSATAGTGTAAAGTVAIAGTGATAGTGTSAGTGATSGTGAAAGTGTAAGSGGAGIAGMIAAGSGGSGGGGAWMPPATSVIKGTAGSCLSTQAQSGGKCGSYYCNVTEAMLGPEINPAGACGGDIPFACTASLAKNVTDCAVEATLTGGNDVAGATRTCVKRDAQVTAHKVTDACIDCFGAVAECCRNDPSGDCLTTCLVASGTKMCDDAQKKAGCLDKLWSCSGLPSPL